MEHIKWSGSELERFWVETMDLDKDGDGELGL
jgi:phage-related protein